jgi:hypothetical protein
MTVNVDRNHEFADRISAADDDELPKDLLLRMNHRHLIR